MKNATWTIGQIIVAFGVIYGLEKGGVINLELSIAVGLLVVLFVISMEQLKNGLQDDLHPMKNALAELQKWLKENSNFIPLHEVKPVGYVKENSPINNTPLGKSLLEESGGKKMIDDNLIRLEGLIEEQKCLTAYDVQSQASKAIATITNEPIMKAVKDFVFEHPKFHEIPLTLADAQRVMVVYLRDIYLSKHPDILPEYDPRPNG